MSEIPRELVMDNDKATRGLIFTPELEAALPQLPEAFKAVDTAQNADRTYYLSSLQGNVFSFRHRLGRVSCAAFWNHAEGSAKEVIATWPPFTDCKPYSGFWKAAQYSEKDSAGLLETMWAKPNSWRQLIKAGTTNELEHALGSGKIVLSFFSMMPMSVYSARGRLGVHHGDFSETAEILDHALGIVQERVHGKRSETQITDVHLAGASQGVQQAIGSASSLVHRQDKYDLKSLTIQEPILMADGLMDLARRFVKGTVGQPSNFDAEGYTKIPEPALLHDLDAHGNEPAMMLRIAQATLLRLGNMKGISRPAKTRNELERVISSGVPVTALVGVNSALAYDSPMAKGYYEPSEVTAIDIQAVAGQYADHLADENVNVVATGIALGTRRASAE